MALTVLGIETSCDETAAAVICSEDVTHQDVTHQDVTHQGQGTILSNIILSQNAEHSPFGGVVPEIAARSHINTLDGIIIQALQEAECRLEELDGIATTAGPGLIGGIMIGLITGKTLALATQLPFLAINHLEGHALTVRLTHNINFPYLLLLISGGHCQIIEVEKLGCYTLYGGTLDDAAGEVFDKAAKLMGLGYPGGPRIEKMAHTGDPQRIPLPRPLTGDGSCNFSFSGLKTAFRVQAQKMAPVSMQDIQDLSASLQEAITDCLTERTRNALKKYAQKYRSEHWNFVIAGGVASNQHIRQALKICTMEQNFTCTVAPINLCTDNAAMIAWAGIERLKIGQNDPLDIAPKARWSLTDLTPP